MTVDYNLKKFEALKGERKHFCADWDYMAIDETYPEFECCTCYSSNVTKPQEPEEHDGN